MNLVSGVVFEIVSTNVGGVTFTYDYFKCNVGGISI